MKLLLKSMIVVVCFFVLKTGIALAQSSLPACQGEVSRWNDCFGSISYPSGNKYVGEFREGMRNGRGTFFYLADNKSKTNGDRYIGEFKDDNFNGQGALIFDGYIVAPAKPLQPA
jgi:hypothetical protein